MSSKFAGFGLPVDVPQRLYLVHPVTHQPLLDINGEQAWVDLLSSDSSAARAHEIDVQRRRFQQTGNRGRIKLSPEELRADATELLVVLTKAWKLCLLDGTPLSEVECNPINAREIYSAPEGAWFRDQVDDFVGDRANFAKASSTS